MALELEGKVYKFLEETSGVGQSSGKAWRRQTFVIETEEQYPKKIAINAWGDLVDAVKQLNVGDKIKVDFRVESREYNERWYTDVVAWRIVKISEQALGNGGSPASPQSQPNDDVVYGGESSDSQTNLSASSEEEEDNLPF